MFSVPGTLILTLGGVSYYRVPSPGLSNAQLVATCRAAGLNAWCHGPPGCYLNGGDCKLTSLSTNCGNPMLPISSHLCGGNSRPTKCGHTQNLYSYMFNWQNGATCGAIYANIPQGWCHHGKSNVAGDVLCVT